jgi:hypothetical protein
MRKATETQKRIKEVINELQEVKEGKPFKYDTAKTACFNEGLKSFENSFNSLLDKGHFKHFATNDFSNQYLIIN